MHCKKIREIKVLTGGEIKLLLNTLEGRDRIAVLLGLYSGLRSGEVFRLRWDDIDFVKGSLRVNSKKHDKAVSIPLPEVLIEELKNYIAKCTGDRLFTDQSESYFIRYFQKLNRKFKRLLSGDVTFKTLRHTFATNLMKVETPIHTVSNLLGHTINTTVGKYACISALEN